MLNIDSDQISIAIDLDQGARLASVQWRDMQFAVPFRGQDLTSGWFAMAPFAGRVKNGVVRDLKGNEYQLPTNFDPPHALNGQAVLSSWEDLGGGRQFLGWLSNEIITPPRREPVDRKKNVTTIK